MYLVMTLLVLLVPKTDCKDTSGPIFLFSMPQMFSTEKDLYLYIVTTGNNPQISVKIITAIDEKEAAEFAVTQRLFEKVNIVIMEEKFYSAVGEGLKPTIQVKATFPVQVYLFMMGGKTIGALVKLLPLEGWGKEYYVVSLAMNPAIIVTAGANRTSVSITMVVSTTYMGSTETNTPNTQFQLEMFESYSVAACNEKVDNAEGSFDSLTGSMISATSVVGVITGSCFSKTMVVECEKKDDKLSTVTDIALENGYPLVFWGKEFIAYTGSYSPRDNISFVPNADLLLMASESDTVVDTGAVSNNQHVYLKKAGNWVILPHAGPQRINASKSILAAYVMRPACAGDTTDYGNPSLSIIIPNRLFYTVYAMRRDDLLNFTAYFIVVFEGNSETTTFQTTHSNNVKPEQVMQVAGNHSWSSGFVPMPTESTEISLPSQAPFGCYVAFIGPKFGAITFADFKLEEIFEKPVSNKTPEIPTTRATLPLTTGIASAVTAVQILTIPTTTATPAVDTSTGPSCVTTDQQPDDQVDNDCDGLIDEETRDDQDNDGDGAVDEDTKTSNVQTSSRFTSEATTLEITNKDSILREGATQPPGLLSGSMSGSTGILAVVVVVLLVLLCLSIILNVLLILRSKKAPQTSKTDKPMPDREEDVETGTASEMNEF